MIASETLQKFVKLLINNEEWLMGRILDYAHQHGFTRYTSTLKEAWRLSVGGLTDSIIATTNVFDNAIPELHPDYTYLDDPACRFGVVEAKKHRERGITLSMFLGLMKYYKQTYIDFITLKIRSKAERNFLTTYTERCFNRIEIAYCTEWSSHAEDYKLKELQNTNRVMANEKNKYLTIFESAFYPTLLLNKEKEIVNINHSAASTFCDIDGSGVIYYNSELARELLTAIQADIHALIKGSDTQVNAIYKLNTNKGVRYFSVSIKKMLDVSAKFNGFVVTMNDISNQLKAEKDLIKAKEKAEESDKLKTAFLANLSHEIRTPMNGIIGFTELLKAGVIPDNEKNNYFDLIEHCGDTLLNLIDDMIDLSKIEAGQLPLNKTNFVLNELLNDVYAYYSSNTNMFQHKSIQFTLSQAPDISEIHMFTDRMRLQQIIYNLLSNAFKYTHEGSIQLACKVIGGKQAIICVTDTGIGIPQDKLNYIFERFNRIEQNDNAIGGAGLGLSICKSLTNMLDGSLKVESEFGKGSSFILSIPIEKIVRKRPSATVVKSKTSTVKRNWADRTILIAEDEELNYDYLFHILKKTSVSVVRVKNGKEAVEYVTSRKPDLVLMDMKMPIKNGFTATREIKELYQNVPIIAQTALALEGDKDKCMLAGCDDYISKPIHPEKLFSILDQFLTRM